MKKTIKNILPEAIFLIVLVLLAISLRSMHFMGALNFMQDQANDSLTALDAIRNHKILLIGSHTAYTYAGRLLFMGPLLIYTYGFFGWLGGFDPAVATYFFMITSCLMIIPLYIGLKMLFNHKTALIMSGLFALFTYYTDYTRFLWNPNFQFAFTPLIFVTMGLFKKTRKSRWNLVSGLLTGLLLQYHFQFVLVLLAVFVWVAFWPTNRIKNIILFILGFAIGWLPYIVFEIRHSFYNVQTVLLFVTHLSETLKSVQSKNIAYYWLTPSLFFLPFGISRVSRHINAVVIAGMYVLLFGATYINYRPTPTRAFLAPTDWKYQDDLTVYRTIRATGITNYNITNLAYDNVASVQKYFHARDRVSHLAPNYRTNQYLFAVSPTWDFNRFKTYEIGDFYPRKQLKRWRINKTHVLYLFIRS